MVDITKQEELVIVRLLELVELVNEVQQLVGTLLISEASYRYTNSYGVPFVFLPLADYHYLHDRKERLTPPVDISDEFDTEPASYERVSAMLDAIANDAGSSFREANRAGLNALSDARRLLAECRNYLAIPQSA